MKFLHNARSIHVSVEGSKVRGVAECVLRVAKVVPGLMFRRGIFFKSVPLN
jgi:hypothetical protein